MKIKHCIAQKKGSGPLIIKISTKEEPSDNSMYYIRHSEGMSWGDFLFKEWKDSFKEYPVKDEQEWLKLAHFITNGNEKHNNLIERRDKALSEGILIDADKVGIENICCQTGIACGYPCNGEENCEKNKYAILLPEEEMEDEEKLWREVDQILGNKSIESLIKMEKLLENFEIRRKSRNFF